MINTPLENAAAMSVSSDLDAMVTDSIEDKLIFCTAEPIETFLDNMIAIQVFDQDDRIQVESRSDDLDLLNRREIFDHLLNCTSAMHIQRYVDEIRSNILHNLEPLLIVTMLEKLLI